MSNTFTQKVGGGLSSRRAAILLSIAALAIAAILLIVYVQSYRSSVSGENAPTSVIVAKSLIPAGTSGTIIATKQQYQATTLPQKDIKVGAISDPAYINGRVAVADIVPGQQLTTADFTVPTTDGGDDEDHRQAARDLGEHRQRARQPQPARRERPHRHLHRPRLARWPVDREAVPAEREGARRARRAAPAT